MMRQSLLILACSIGACTTPQVSPPVVETRPPPESRAPADLPPEIKARNVRQLIERDARTYGSAEGLTESRRASTSIVAHRSPSFPYTTRQPDGSYTPTPPSVAVAVRTPAGWVGWRGNGARFQFDQDTGRELDRLLATNELWREPPFPSAGCTDPSGTGAIVRHGERLRVTMHPCGPEGLSGRLVTIVLAGRVPEWRGVPPEAVPQGIAIRHFPEEVQQQFRFNSGIREPRNLVIRNEGEWLGQWRRITSRRSPSALPEVDFGRDMLLLAALGTKPTGGYGITIRRVVDLGDALEVHVVRTSPGPRCGVTAALTEPVDIVLVPATDKRVRWVAHDMVRDCP